VRRGYKKIANDSKAERALKLGITKFPLLLAQAKLLNVE
jgi:hypothetical protein